MNFDVNTCLLSETKMSRNVVDSCSCREINSVRITGSSLQ